MDQPPYSAAWLSRWRDEITDAVGAMVSTFEATHGYPPGRNEVRVADDDDRRAAREYARETLGFEELRTFYASIGEVVLSDVGNGYFIHSARDVLHRLAEEGDVAIPDADDPLGMVIGSDGGASCTSPTGAARSTGPGQPPWTRGSSTGSPRTCRSSSTSSAGP
ncbi:SMI1/KNR4 family protein [Streptomyces sp. AD2-2]|nr:SMI1/KNR4 family protein [Streptomyces sp. AD2-2]